MTTDNKQELKSTGWTGGFGAPKQKTRRIHPSPTQQVNLTPLPPAMDNDDPRSQRRISVESQVAPEETHWTDCFKKCMGK